MIRKFMDLSTAHVDEESRDILDKWADDQDNAETICGKHQYGWFFYAPEEGIETWPLILQNLVGYARFHDCEYINLDRDGDILHDVHIFDW